MEASGVLHYLGLFTLYTLLAIGAIYGVYWYLRKSGASGMLPFAKKSVGGQKLEIESMMPLEARKNLYVIRSGNERFLIATSVESTQFLSRLETTPGPETAPAPRERETPANLSLPGEEPRRDPAELAPVESGFGARLMHSLRWIVSSRFKLT